jgi:N-acetylneuraminic acid mutarotase
VFRAPLDGDGNVGAWITEQLQSPRSHHVSFVVDDWLYIAGGLEGSPNGQNTILSDVSRAPIDQEGALGAWESVGQLPAALATMAPLVRGRCAYLFGGLQGFSYSPTVLASAIDEEGRTGEWVALPSALPEGRSHMHHVALLGDRVYLGGGSISYQTVTPHMAIGSFVMP